MRIRAATALAGVLMGLLVPSSTAAEPVRILVYGDSITQGSTGDWTWRYRLDRHLREAGVAFDLVGPRDDLHPYPGPEDDPQGYADPDFDTDAAAVWGQALRVSSYDLSDTAADYGADVVVALIGLNDVAWLGATPAEMEAAWTDEIEDARAAHPGISFVLGQVPEIWYAGVSAYNAMLVALAATLDRPDARVVATALPVLLQDRDTWDGTHPSATGEVAIAAAVEDALAGIGVGTPAGMLPVVANGPSRIGELSATPVAGGFDLSWAQVAGPDAVWLERRDVTAGEDWVRYPIPFDPAQSSWQARGLVDGDTYELRLRPAKGYQISTVVTSTVVTAVAGEPSPATDPPSARPADETTVDPLASDHPATTPPTSASAEPPAAVRRVHATSPRRGVVRVSGRRVTGATAYELLTATATSCRRMPAPGRFEVVRTVPAPQGRLRTPAGYLWIRLVALRDGVPGTVAKRSTDCVRVR